MNTYPQVGKTPANFPALFANVGKLANACQLESPSNQWLPELSANWQVGNAANLPTARNPHGDWVSARFEVGENSPSYYVGEGTTLPSPQRREVLAGLEPSAGQRPALLAIDLGTTTGWALHHRDGLIDHGFACFRPQRFEGGGMRYLRFKRWLTEIKALAGEIDTVYFEEVRRHAGVDAAHAYGGFLATLTAWCEHHRIPYQGVPVGTIKKHATGKGNASKEDVIAAIQALGHPVTDDNEADALALLHWAIDTEGV